MSVSLVARRPLVYHHVSTPAGARFTASARDAAILVAAGDAVEAPPETRRIITTRPDLYGRRDLRAAESPRAALESLADRAWGDQ